MAEKTLHYSSDLRVPIKCSSGASPHVQMHRVEWGKVMDGKPVEINPSVGDGMRVSDGLSDGPPPPSSPAPNCPHCCYVLHIACPLLLGCLLLLR